VPASAVNVAPRATADPSNTARVDLGHPMGSSPGQGRGISPVVRGLLIPIEDAEIPTASVDGGSVYLPQLLSDQFGQSNSHWRRVIEQGGVRIDGEPVRELELPAERLAGSVIQAGKRQFLKVSAS